MSLDEVMKRIDEFPDDREIVFYCACPNDASAALATRRLMDRGYSRVRPLRGGLDAWAAAGYEIESRLGADGRVKAGAAAEALASVTAPVVEGQ